MNPTPRQLDTLAALFQAGGSNTLAAEALGVQPQVVRNTLLAFRRQERTATNLMLAMQHMKDIQFRQVSRRVA